MKGESQRGN